MADPDPSTAMTRINAAIARIEQAIDRRGRAAETMQQRHTALKMRMVEAVAALDDVLARQA